MPGFLPPPLGGSWLGGGGHLSRLLQLKRLSTPILNFHFQAQWCAVRTRRRVTVSSPSYLNALFSKE